MREDDPKLAASQRDKAIKAIENTNDDEIEELLNVFPNIIDTSQATNT